jgi:hypothetical protein
MISGLGDNRGMEWSQGMPCLHEIRNNHKPLNPEIQDNEFVCMQAIVSGYVRKKYQVVKA